MVLLKGEVSAPGNLRWVESGRWEREAAVRRWTCWRVVGDTLTGRRRREEGRIRFIFGWFRMGKGELMKVRFGRKE